MDERILVEVYVPAAMYTYDVYLPKHKIVKDIKEILFSLLEELNNGVFIPLPQTALYGERIQAILADEKTLQEERIVQGDKLIVL